MSRSLNLLRSLLVASTFTTFAVAQGGTSDCALPTHPVAVSYIAQARRAESRNEFFNAVNIYIKVLEGDPNNECVTNMVSELFGRMRYFQQQMLWANRAIDLNRKFIEAYISLGNAQNALGDTDDAKRTFKKAAEVAPTNPLPYFSLGMLADDREKFSDAISHYKRAIEVDPKFEDAYYNLAAIYSDLGKNQDAKEMLRKLLEINPNAQDARALLRKIQ